MVLAEKQNQKAEMMSDIKQIEAVLKIEKDLINSELFTDEETLILIQQIKIVKTVVNNLIL